MSALVVQLGARSPLVSVVIPCYNNVRYLDQAIDSVLRQTYRLVEIIVVDDGSTDDTSRVARSRPGIRYAYQTNAGLAAARNRGIRESRGDYLLFLDADDTLVPCAIAQAVHVATEHPDCGFIYGQFRFVDHVGRTLRAYDPAPDNPDTYLGLFGGNHIAMCASVLFPRTVLERVGGFRPELRASEDYDLYFRIARLFPYYRHGAMMAECRRHEGNMSADAALMLRSTLQVMRSQRAYLGTAQQLRAYRSGLSIWKEYYGGLLIRQLKRHAREHHLLQAGEDAKVLLKLAPGTLFRSAARRLRTGVRSWFRGGTAKRVRRTFSRPAFGRLEPASRDFGYRRGTPIDRYYIERALASCAADIQGRVLEIKDDIYTHRFGGNRVARADVLDRDSSNPLATIVSDLTNGRNIPANTFDAVILTQTLHVIYDVQAAVRTVHRILKPGGVMLASLPGISQIARDRMNNWQDQWRFTGASARRMFDDVFGRGRVSVSVYGNLSAAMNYLDGRAAEEMSVRKLNFLDDDYQLVIFVRAAKAAGIAGRAVNAPNEGKADG